METLNCERFRVCMGTAEEVLTKGTEAEYLIATTHFNRTAEIASLQNVGFSFHDRLLQIGINVASVKKRLAEMPVAADGITITETSDFTDEMFRIACSAFDTDRRFHLEEGFTHRECAAEVIEASVRRYLAHGVRIIRAAHGDDVLGCVMILDDSRGGTAPMFWGLPNQGLKEDLLLFRSMPVSWGCWRVRHIRGKSLLRMWRR